MLVCGREGGVRFTKRMSNIFDPFPPPTGLQPTTHK